MERVFKRVVWGYPNNGNKKLKPIARFGIILGSYLITYYTEENAVEVLRILHSSSSVRNIKSAKSAKKIPLDSS
jgi:plasmid stabilization system protein ParE